MSTAGAGAEAGAGAGVGAGAVFAFDAPKDFIQVILHTNPRLDLESAFANTISLTDLYKLRLKRGEDGNVKIVSVRCAISSRSQLIHIPLTAGPINLDMFAHAVKYILERYQWHMCNVMEKNIQPELSAMLGSMEEKEALARITSTMILPEDIVNRGTWPVRTIVPFSEPPTRLVEEDDNRTLSCFVGLAFTGTTLNTYTLDCILRAAQRTKV